MILVNPVAALAAHSQASKRNSGLQQRPRRPGLIDLSHWTSHISPDMDGDQVSVDCPGFVPRGPGGLGRVEYPTSDRSARLSSSFERPGQRL